ncbi:hypothetical protein C7N43_02055 [Sphingobacteriales bacterium UPWRP_1]|nr:hypothetical protein B6N25_15400 [Sphingobacteriales bacterium TSM_CSS]PSJ78807.1 hypothetical protein C7N43_02055 [Sphingobacteriales bacterium UPWRP_1]
MRYVWLSPVKLPQKYYNLKFFTPTNANIRKNDRFVRTQIARRLSFKNAAGCFFGVNNYLCSLKICLAERWHIFLQSN